jgi:DNA-binding CsgD family transcriptional regulator/tetratricopeptide (TPR) repeat protein
VLPGRADEGARIDRLLDGARGGVSAALIVHGDPGIGKTALLDEVAAAAAGFTVLRAQPLQTESELPFAGLSDLLRPLLPLLDRIPEPQAAVLSGALALGPPTPGDRFAAAAATLSLLAAGAEEAPVLAVVDDAHWLDTPSREALLFAGRRLGGEGVVLLLAMRDRPWLEAAGIERLELRGLEPDAAEELVARTGRAVSSGVRERLVADTAGNPLAFLEAIATLSDAQLGGSAPIVGPIAVGRSVERSFAQRLEPLPDETRRALLIAAASYSGDATEIALALAGMGLASSALDAAEREGLVTTQAGRVEFRHPVLRSAAYHVADPVERRAAHRALAGALNPGQHDRIAWHLAAATAGPDEEVARLLEDSATAAQGRRGYVAAANALATAARLSPAVSDRIRRTIRAAGAFRLGGEAQKAADILAETLHLVSDPLVRADMQQLRAAALMYVSPMMETFALLVDEADRVEPYDRARAATILAIATNAGAAAAEIDLVVETARRAARLSRAVGGPVEMLTALALATGLTLAGRIGEARGIFEPLIPVLETIDPLSEAGFLLVATPAALIWMGDPSTARRMLERIVGVARGASAVTLLPYPLAMLSELELRCGRLAAAYAAATESVRLAAETGQAGLSSYSLVALARVEALRGLESECRGHVAAALEGSRRLGATSIENYAASVLGVLELSFGRPERATAHLEKCARLEIEYGLKLPDVVPWNADLIEAYVRVGRAEDAVRELETLEEQGRATGSRWAAAAAARCRGLLADEDGYETILLRALELHGDHEPFERARTELCLGRRRRHARHRSAARVVLHQALSTFETLGAEPWAEQARVELRATGETPAPSPGGSLMTLTPQELQVALVVAGGATNREVGASLFISPKTVEFHLGHVYGKLGVRSRTELVRKVAGLP